MKKMLLQESASPFSLALSIIIITQLVCSCQTRHGKVAEDDRVPSKEMFAGAVSNLHKLKPGMSRKKVFRVLGFGDCSETWPYSVGMTCGSKEYVYENDDCELYLLHLPSDIGYVGLKCSGATNVVGWDLRSPELRKTSYCEMKGWTILNRTNLPTDLR